MALKVSGAIRTTKPLAQLFQTEFDHTITTEKYHPNSIYMKNFFKGL